MTRVYVSVIAMVAGAVIATAAVATTGFAQASATVNIGGNDDLRRFLVGPNGHTLYVFMTDTPGTSTCFDQCEANWPPLIVSSGQSPTKALGVLGSLGTYERPNGSRQVTLDDHPLYYWAFDSAPGDATGQGVGGVWFVVNAQAQSPSNPTPQTTPVADGTTPAPPATGTGVEAQGTDPELRLWSIIVVSLALTFSGGILLVTSRR